VNASSIHKDIFFSKQIETLVQKDRTNKKKMSCLLSVMISSSNSYRVTVSAGRTSVCGSPVYLDLDLDLFLIGDRESRLDLDLLLTGVRERRRRTGDLDRRLTGDLDLDLDLDRRRGERRRERDRERPPRRPPPPRPTSLAISTLILYPLNLDPSSALTASAASAASS